MISGVFFLVGIILFVVLWVATSKAFLSRGSDLAVEEEGAFDLPPTECHQEGASAETTPDAPESSPEQEPAAASSFSSEPQADHEIAKSVTKKAVPRNAMSVKKKAKRPKRKN